jgi:superfamily I DNA/RNA helicase
VEEGIDPGSILSVTFTNKAANEMRTRIAGMVSPAAQRNLPGSRRPPSKETRTRNVTHTIRTSPLYLLFRYLY